MRNLKKAIAGASLVLCAGASAALAQSEQPEQRHVAGDFVIGGEECGQMKWYWPDKNFPGSGFSWEIEGCDALDDLIDGVPTTPNPDPTPTPTPTVPIDQGNCPPGALWLDQPIPGNENAAEGLAAVTFGPNETKYFCSRLAPEEGNAKRFQLGASGRDNDHTCESMRLEIVSIPEQSTADLSGLVSGSRGSRNPYVNVAFYIRDADVGMDAPPGLYIMKATEMFGEREPGQQVCRTFQMYKLLKYP